MSRDIAPFGLRMPAEFKEQIASAAEAAGRSMNAEIMARLYASFGPQVAVLPPYVQDAVEDEIKERGGTPEEALTRLVLAGQAGGGTFLFATISPQTTMKQFLAMLGEAKMVIPADASVVFQRK